MGNSRLLYPLFPLPTPSLVILFIPGGRTGGSAFKSNVSHRLHYFKDPLRIIGQIYKCSEESFLADELGAIGY